uniref:Transcription factor HNF-4 homolog (inferred by orthology to a D. melanogaster protein) n=1 Tax=Strongyloides venezuelensis TaxID=75913 RepID=A0A0K0FCJ2_STRVS
MILSQSPRNEKTNGRNVVIPENCVICGRSANCYHYDIISCNGCKTFFRRSVLANKNYKCRFNGKCINGCTARCKKCRFDKCLNSGMDPRRIQFPSNWTEDQISFILQKYNNYKNLHNDDDYQIQKNNCLNCSYQSIVNPSISEFQSTVSNTISNLTYIECKFKLLRESAFNGHELFGIDLHNYLLLSSKLSDAEKYNIPTDWPKPMNEPKEKHIFEFTKEDHMEHKRNPKFKPNHKPWFHLDQYLVVDYLKTLNFFSHISHEDKINLIKNIGSAIYVAGIVFYSCIRNKESIYFPDGFEPLKIHKKVFPIENEVFKKSVDTFHRVKLTNEEFCLLKILITVSSCSFRNISEKTKNILEKEKAFYSNVLLKYLQNKLGTMEGVKRCMEIVMFIETVNLIGEKFKELDILIDMVHSRIHDNKKRRPIKLFINT